ncbi:MAG: response regulator [Bdellovibrionota bacterium]
MIPTILIVDDEDDLREAIAFDFRRKNFNVLLAASGNEAYKIVASQRVDIVLSDARMPDGSGLELLERIKEKNVFIPVVMFITAFADISLEEAYDKGADAVFSKPFDRKVLYEAVQRAIQPIGARLLRKTSRVDVELTVELKFLKSGFSVPAAKIQNIGRGGMFVALPGQFPDSLEEVEFRLESTMEPKFIISGTGIVRWIRQASAEPFPSGCGIEFVGLDGDCLRQVIELINFLKTKCYIPRK